MNETNGFADRVDRDCSKWDEVEFVNYCQDKLLPDEKALFELHLKTCPSCQDRVNLFIDVVLNYSEEERQADEAFLNLNNPKWKQTRERLINNLIEMSKRQNADAKLSEQHLVASKRGRGFYSKRSLKAAVILLLALVPILVTYKMLIQPWLADNKSGISELYTSKNPAPTQYERLNQELDSYLSLAINGQTAEHLLNKANSIAQEIANRTGDRYGEDLIAYYRTASANILNELHQARIMRDKTDKIKLGEGFNQALEDVTKVKAIFEKYGAHCEVEATDLVIIRFLRSMGKYDEAQALITDSIKMISDKHYNYIEAQLLYRQGQLFSERSRFSDAIDSLSQALRIAEPLKVDQFSLIVSTQLTSIYFITNDDERTLKQGQVALTIAESYKNISCQLQLLQIIGMSAFNLNNPTFAEECLRRSISLAIEKEEIPFLTISYSFLGIILAEQKKFPEAETAFNNAMGAVRKINDETARISREWAVMGYYAREQMLAGNVNKSEKLYDRALDLAKQANVEQKLALAQLHEGLGASLMASGNSNKAQSELVTAKILQDQAIENSEAQNDLLTFALYKNGNVKGNQNIK